MFTRHAPLVLFCGLLLFSATPALAQSDYLTDEPFHIDGVPANWREQLFGVGPPPHENFLYANTLETASRFNPGTGGNPLGSGVQHDVIFDDVPVPLSRLAGQTTLDVTRVTVGIRRGPQAPATDVNLFFANAVTNAIAPDTQLGVPFFPVATQSLALRGAQTFATELVTFGDGASTLFTVPLNTTLLEGFGTFMLGIQFSNADTLNGWRVTAGPDLNTEFMWIYDTDLPDPAGVYTFGGLEPVATFWITIEGNPVPEPASLGLVVVSALLALRRRR